MQDCLWNEKYKLEGKWRLRHEILRKYTDLKPPEQVNLSPLKQGPKPSLPPVFLDLLQVHVSMCQLSGNRACKPKQLKALLEPQYPILALRMSSQSTVFIDSSGVDSLKQFNNQK